MDGIIPLFKPAGLTSHDCVARLRKLLGTKKVGHTGTLDPAVTGVLPICINRATKVAEYMSDYNKTYEAVVSLGSSTTTEDQTGEIVDKKVIDNITSAEIEHVLNEFIGTIKQIPPMYSAVKIDGKKLYEYARAGKTVERPARTVEILSLKLLSDPSRVESGNVTFKIQVSCSKGTYVRTLAVDIGKRLGVPAHMALLVRTQSGPFKLEDTISFDELEEVVNDGRISEYVLPIEKAVSIFPSTTVSGALEQQVLNGAVLEETKSLSNLRTAVYNEQGECLAIYKPHPKRPGWVKPEKVIKI
ncbi:tRNA pseudouridine(55) synthase TruB [Alkalihalobacillus sp. AL-G]|uniref:tRNA pseudouridine(55) synthase TruB n=1 Tax=Alkalihalobacillus sp. AL-G TaxID=2926399 RepID=UPI002729D458|nr:tRNA pseudouridine(55) synthase TruB [Alkalihalobacillus sp. AL-G]WLD95385.1 tRNA pseudouridine(55) synthase TruB [Alkalihalobacillus sp. AL-G]